MKRFETVASGLSVVIALVACVTSIYSCSHSERALQIAQEEIARSRSTTWAIRVVGNSLQLRSSSDQVRLQRVALFLPLGEHSSGAAAEAIEVWPPDFSIGLERLRNLVMSEQVQQGGAGNRMTYLVGIDAQYASGGRVFNDLSLYSLDYDWSEADSTIQFRDLLLVRPLASLNDLREVLDEGVVYRGAAGSL